MLFTSITFLGFFVIFFLLYWFLFNKNLNHQNLLILLGSYAFYMWWDWRFLVLLIVLSALTYRLGIAIYRNKNRHYQRLLILVGLFIGIGQLTFFKYFDFFVDSFNKILFTFNIRANFDLLNLIIPIGISYYTFRVVSYLLDIYKGKIAPTTNWAVYLSYVAFFPCLISGPIDKAGLLIPQLERKRNFDYHESVDGMRQILWGFFKKIVIADNCAAITNQIFNSYADMSSSTLMMGGFLFTIQLYADFSGYSDMAIGFSRLIGFNVTKNFDFPLFAQNIAEFWRKWHISLTSWLTEYVFTPLNIAFRDYGMVGIMMAILINFILIGFWHGASWTYVLFGALHGLYYVPLIIRGNIFKRKKIAKNRLLPSFHEATNMISTFVLVMFSLILFKSNTVGDALSYFSLQFTSTLFTLPQYFSFGIFFLIAVFLIIEWLGRDKEFAIEDVNLSMGFRWSLYLTMVILIFLNSGKQQEFVYFQF